jgi:hypothetical protein
MGEMNGDNNNDDVRQIPILTGSCTKERNDDGKYSSREQSRRNNGDSSSSRSKAAVNAYASTVPTLLATQSSSPPPPDKSASNTSYTSWGYMRQHITGMMDDQRLHRLQQCRVLQEVLSDCRRQSSSSSRDTSSTSTNKDTDTTRRRRLELEDVPAGIRMVKYFNWRDWQAPETVTADNNNNDGSSNKSNTKSKKGGNNHCLREEHAVWACRGVALSCGAPLAQLKSCFDETPGGVDAVLASTNQTAYEPEYKAGNNDNSDQTNKTSKTPCQWQQQALGDCVAAAAVQLQERQESKASTGN